MEAPCLFRRGASRLHRLYEVHVTVDSGKVVRPQLVEGIGSWPLFPDVYVIGSSVLDRYISVPAGKVSLVWEAVSFFDGSRSLDEISEILRARGCRVDVSGLYTRLAEAGLLIGSTPRREVARLGVEMFDIPIDRLLAPCLGIIGKLFLPLVWLTGLVMAVAIVVLASGAVITPDGGTVSSVAGYAMVGGGIFLSMFLHESAHAIAALRHGLVPNRLRISGYLLVIPVALLAIPGLYTIAPAKRIQVWAAGMWANLTIASLALIAIEAASMPSVYAQILTKVALANCMIVVWNLMPFLPTDGYFILTTLLRRANVRPKAWDALLTCRRAGSSASPWLLAYALASAFLMLAIVMWSAAGITVLLRNSVIARILIVLAAALTTGSIWHRRVQRQRTESGR